MQLSLFSCLENIFTRPCRFWSLAGQSVSTIPILFWYTNFHNHKGATEFPDTVDAYLLSEIANHQHETFFFIHSNNWKGHLGISVSELCFKNALGLLINNRSNFQEEWIIVQKIAATFWEERIIAWKFAMNHRAKRIIIRKIAWIKTIGVTKMWGNFVEISFQAKFLQKATKSQEFRRNLLALLLHNTVWYVNVSLMPLILVAYLQDWGL